MKQLLPRTCWVFDPCACNENQGKFVFLISLVPYGHTESSVTTKKKNHNFAFKNLEKILINYPLTKFLTKPFYDDVVLKIQCSHKN